MKSRDVVRYAQEHSFLRHGKGSHEVYAHPDFDYVLVLPMHGSKDIGPGLLAKLLKHIDGTWR
jgi:predicted RNA binding protein YcfA (HicA-like mRNA interferase family)